MKFHMSNMRTAGPAAHPHLHSFFHRTHERTIVKSWTANHLTLTSLAITCLIACMVAGFLILFQSYQMTGIWPLFGR